MSSEDGDIEVTDSSDFAGDGEQKGSQLTVPDESNAARICVVGLGYVGLPLAHRFDRSGYDVVGFDTDPDKVERLDSGVDPTGEVGDREIEHSDLEFASDAEVIGLADVVIVTVQTPVDDLEKPDLRFVRDAGATIGEHITRDTVVVLESTVFPGATKSEFVPAIEDTSGLVAGEDFGVGYSPERMVPGEDRRDFRNIVKIVSGLTDETVERLAEHYGAITDSGIHEAPSIEAAEAAKCVENIQRDLNIALVNELAVACHHLDLDTTAILEAAGTKWNFHDYRPGLVGGHCIPVDPFYLIYEAERNGFSPELIQKAREVNEYIPKHIADMLIESLEAAGKAPARSRVLILGMAYKPNIGDVRRSAIDGVIKQLESNGVEVACYDPNARNEVIRSEFDVTAQQTLSFDGFDGVLVGTPHDEFETIEWSAVPTRMTDQPVMVDVDGTFERHSDAFRYTKL